MRFLVIGFQSDVLAGNHDWPIIGSSTQRTGKYIKLNFHRTQEETAVKWIFFAVICVFLFLVWHAHTIFGE